MTDFPEMPKRRKLALCRGCWTLGGWIILGLIVLPPVGCRGVPADTEPKPAEEAMFPSLRLNEDLVKSFKPSNRRDWVPEQAVLARADFDENRLTVHNIRDCRWPAPNEVATAHYDKTFDLDKLRSVDFIVVPFNETPSLGHTMISFGFEGGEYLAVSVEIRRERGEAFNPIKGFIRQYELMYVVAGERDLIQKRVACDLCDVYLYRSTATKEQARKLLADVMRRVNKLYEEPEFYDTLTNNCTTNIRNHINNLRSDRVPYDYRVLLPGYSDRLAFDLGLIERHGSYQETRLRARVNYQAYLHRDDSAFSRAIRL
ncbi:MAG: DUF4105 domain-containing protein [Planctomycetes bacterium]|nr:DUF4105 domain-containing protein [Planctomycetota bacterium]MBU4398481.1 DUF4105 domain-containing protein [Planctomycetota bacterium]MCG2685425.1 DUF4105 domain-containing protein [Planctomycetales bacterium]